MTENGLTHTHIRACLTKARYDDRLSLDAVQLTEVDDHREHREEEPTVWAQPGFVSAFLLHNRLLYE